MAEQDIDEEIVSLKHRVRELEAIVKKQQNKIDGINELIANHGIQ